MLCRLDLGATRDMTALILVFAGDNGDFDVFRFVGCPAKLCRSESMRIICHMAVWAEQGILLTFPGRSTDPRVVAMKIAELHGRYHIEQLGFDRWRIEDLQRELGAIGCNVELVLSVRASRPITGCRFS